MDIKSKFEFISPVFTINPLLKSIVIDLPSKFQVIFESIPPFQTISSVYLGTL